MMCLPSPSTSPEKYDTVFTAWLKNFNYGMINQDHTLNRCDGPVGNCVIICEFNEGDDNEGLTVRWSREHCV